MKRKFQDIKKKVLIISVILIIGLIMCSLDLICFLVKVYIFKNI
ncbi:hypothetical protein [Clostridium perfringens]|uniref:Uncharacterized protein n=1 Tax=Clostridium perfringens E str. JGS1987 TaxID=451755 RepID=B1BR83_CLOPF|nr:hypothetical protein [Clostridium perfringens]EDT15827.1 hypothetical protein AC3_A0213 [Clostridium perfringens E str. JGS1987]